MIYVHFAVFFHQPANFTSRLSLHPDRDPSSRWAKNQSPVSIIAEFMKILQEINFEKPCSTQVLLQLVHFIWTSYKYWRSLVNLPRNGMEFGQSQQFSCGRPKKKKKLQVINKMLTCSGFMSSILFLPSVAFPRLAPQDSSSEHIHTVASSVPILVLLVLWIPIYSTY